MKEFFKDVFQAVVAMGLLVAVGFWFGVGLYLGILSASL